MTKKYPNIQPPAAPPQVQQGVNPATGIYSGGAPASPKYSKKKTILAKAYNIFQFLNNKVLALNSSKIFAGIMIIILNISSKFVTIKMSKSIESYLKYTFSRDILVFAIVWMGTRDIYIALCMTLLFVFCIDYLFNENSRFCCLPERFTNYHTELLETNTKTLTPEDIQQMKNILEKLGNMENFENKSVAAAPAPATTK
jgi:hypothetical protein